MISNKIRIKNAPDVIIKHLVKYLTIDNPVYIEASKQGYSTYGITNKIINFNFNLDGSINIPRGCRKYIISLFAEYNISDYKVIDKRFKGAYNYNIDTSMIKYRPYQMKAINTLMNSEDEGILVSPAGSGKTVMGLSLIPIIGQPTLWLTHTKALVNQVIDRIKYFLPSLEKDDIGIIGQDKWTIGKVITIGMVPTLVRRLNELNKLIDKFGLVILDEAHHCPATTFTKVITRLNPYFLYALTATPYRRDKLENSMFQIVGPVLVKIPISEIEKDGGIIMPTVRYRTINSQIITENNNNKIISEYIIGNNKRNGIIIGDVLKEAFDNNTCIVVSDRKEHCEELYKLIAVSWDKCGIATGNYKDLHVKEQIKLLEDKKITVLVTTFALLGEGFDVDFLNRVFITCPFRAESKLEQIVGRVQRAAHGKKDAIVYDYVDVNVGIFKNQFYSKGNSCRYKVYTRLGLSIEPY